MVCFQLIRFELIGKPVSPTTGKKLAFIDRFQLIRFELIGKHAQLTAEYLNHLASFQTNPI